jgi:hypothetical protein
MSVAAQDSGRLDGADTFQGVTGTHPDQSPTPYPIPQPLMIRLPFALNLDKANLEVTVHDLQFS